MTKRSKIYFEKKQEVKQWAKDWVNFHISNTPTAQEIILPALNINYITPESLKTLARAYNEAHKDCHISVAEVSFEEAVELGLITNQSPEP